MGRDLERYAGRYLVGWGWQREDSISRFLHFTRDGEALSVQTETITIPMGTSLETRDDPVVDRMFSEAKPLAATGEHRFDAVGFPRSYQFSLGEMSAADSVIVTRDGELSEPCQRYVEMPEEIPGRREVGEWFDLGNPTICMMLEHTQELFRFYQRIGFTLNPTRPNNVINGWTVVGFLDFQRQSCINYRGPSVVETAFELARRGYPVANGLTDAGAALATHVQGNGAGSVSVPDPDGHHLFFNTHLRERVVYDAWLRGELQHERSIKAFNVGGTEDQNEKDYPVTLPLGDLAACLSARDLAASVGFYEGMGFTVLDRTSTSALVFSEPARENKFAFPIHLSEEKEPSFSFGFLCDDVAGISKELEDRDVDLISTAYGPAFVDPDGNVVTLFEPLSS